MPARMSLAKEISGRVAASPIDRSHTVSDGVAQLVSRRAALDGYVNVEELIVALDELPALKPISHHFGRVTSALGYELWSRQIFIGASVLDELLFQALKDRSVSDPIENIVDVILSSGLNRPGFVVYPLHSLALLGAGLLQRKELRFSIPRWGLSLTPQTNSKERTLRFLRDAARRIGVRHLLDAELVNHWMRSRPVTWLWRNPLIALRVESFPGRFYENQRLLLAKLEFAASAIYALSTQKDPRTSVPLRHFSSLNTNNFETRDIKHYLVFFPTPDEKVLSGDCVPFTLEQNKLIELCEFSVDIDPTQWLMISKPIRRVLKAIIELRSGYYQHAIRGHRTDVHARVYRKFATSLGYFRRSFRRSAPLGEPAVNLSTAFEVLLTDQETKGTRDRIARRIRRLFRGSRVVNSRETVFQHLYDERCDVVHEGRAKKFDVRAAQELYVDLLVRVVERLPGWAPAPTCKDPMRELIGDPTS